MKIERHCGVPSPVTPFSYLEGSGHNFDQNDLLLDRPWHNPNDGGYLAFVCLPFQTIHVFFQTWIHAHNNICKINTKV